MHKSNSGLCKLDLRLFNHINTRGIKGSDPSEYVRVNMSF